MCYSGYMTENMVEQKETATAGPEGAVNTSGAQASGQNAERSYEVVAVIPIELFTQKNLNLLQEDGNDSYNFSPVTGTCESSDEMGRISIEKHIRRFSAYCYKIFKITPRSDGKESLHSIILNMLNEQVRDEDDQLENKNDNGESGFKLDQIEILLAVPDKVSESRPADREKDSAEMFENTSITISIIVSVNDSEIGKNGDKAKKLKAVGDVLKELVGESAEKNVKEILRNKGKTNNQIESIIDILGKDFKNEITCENNGVDSNNIGTSGIQKLDEMIEVNYVFTYFICYGYKYHIVVDKILDVEDNIKYSGDAWFLKSSTVGLYKFKDGETKGKTDFDYISENYWNKQRTNDEPTIDLGKYEKEENTHGWLVNELIPESQIRPRDIFYIPKINGREDYTSIILKYVNRFCCFVKASEKDNRKNDSDDGNRVIGMQIVLQSFWHRMTEFSRVLHRMSQIEKCELEPDTKKRFMNQVHTTPTVAEQIVDVNSDDIDVMTLLDLARATKIDSAARIFNESKRTYLAIDAHEQTEERRQATEKANRGLQSMFLALALLTYALGLTELWGEWTTISDSWKTVITILFPIILAAFYFGFYYWEKLCNFFK